MASDVVLTSSRKALQINMDGSLYGTFAEIGAGQEVARHFFTAGMASHTIAKTMSAYDMTISDAIYGKTSRYVCEDRLTQMLDHEYELLVSRLQKKRGKTTRFFTFADTVATSSQQDFHRCHGWMGIRFQTRPEGPSNDIFLHVRLFDSKRLDQQEALGILGVNLIYATFLKRATAHEFVHELHDNLGSHRAEIDLLIFRGPDLHSIDNRDLAIELVRQGLSKAILFGPEGNLVQAADTFFKRPLVVQRGVFRPVTKINQDILEKGLSQLPRLGDLNAQEPLPLMEITLQSADHNKSMESSELKDILQRVETLTQLKIPVLISRYQLFYELKQFLRSCTQNTIGFVIGAAHLEKIFGEIFYQHLPGKLLEAMGHLFDEKAGLLVYPYRDQKNHLTAQKFSPQEPQKWLFQYLLKMGRILDMTDCDHLIASHDSREVRDLMLNNDPQWEKLVPQPVVELIRSKKFFT